MINLKTEIEKINQEIEDILKSIPESRIATCVPLVFKKGKKQGLIQGAKMMIDVINERLADIKEGFYNYGECNKCDNRMREIEVLETEEVITKLEYEGRIYELK